MPMPPLISNTKFLGGRYRASEFGNGKHFTSSENVKRPDLVHDLLVRRMLIKVIESVVVNS